MSIGRTVGLQRPLCTAAHGVVGARDRVLFWTLRKGRVLNSVSDPKHHSL